MKKILALSIAALSLAAFATAQEAGPGRGAPAGGAKQGQRRGGALMFLQKALERLDLNTDQKGKLKKVADGFRADIKKLREAPGTREEKGPKMRELSKKMMTDVEAILTPEQRTKFQQYLKEERAKMRKNRRGPGVPPPVR